MAEFSLSGKIAIITGASKGIGRAIALAFAAAGGTVVLAARKPDALDRAAEELTRSGAAALGVSTDVSDPDQVSRLVERTVEAFGTVDILVNNAGAAPFLSPVEEIRLDGFEKYFRVNFMGAVHCTRAVGPILLAKRSGCVLNISSVAAFVASPGLAYYASAKAALIGFTKTVAGEWASAGVRVNALAPGWIETEMNEGARAIDEFHSSVVRSIPLGRWGSAEEVAAAALFLCSPAASFITGAVLVVDGGQTVSNLGAGS
ncbi:3-oxoacyl-ACP reductase FabG [soil metagenome]